MTEILRQIKDAVTMKDMDELRDAVVTDKNPVSLQAWQKKYKNLHFFRKQADVGYKYDRR